MGNARTVRRGTQGKRALSLVLRDGTYFGLADRKICVEGDDPDQVWARLRQECGKADPDYFGYAGARTRFLSFFPNGFRSDGFATQERDYKLAAKAKLERVAPLDAALDGTGLGEAVLGVFRATNLLPSFEQIRVQDALRGSRADEVVRAAARFTQDRDAPSLRRLAVALEPCDAAKWTIATYLPFLWQPERHMFLKPEVTKDFAVRVGHPFATAYEARLTFPVYESLLDMVGRTQAEVEDLGPCNGIDIQSLIWIVGSYQPERDGLFA